MEEMCPNYGDCVANVPRAKILEALRLVLSNSWSEKSHPDKENTLRVFQLKISAL
jgi:hypothetical protein